MIRPRPVASSSAERTMGASRAGRCRRPWRGWPALRGERVGLLEEERDPALVRALRNGGVLSPPKSRTRTVATRPRARRGWASARGVLLLRRPRRRLQEGELGADEADSLGAGGQPGLDLGRARDVDEDPHGVAVGRDRGQARRGGDRAPGRAPPRRGRAPLAASGRDPGRRITSPASPSTTTGSPSLAASSSSPAPTTSGRPRARATIAAWAVTPPAARAIARTSWSSSATSAGPEVRATRRVGRPSSPGLAPAATRAAAGGRCSARRRRARRASGRRGRRGSRPRVGRGLSNAARRRGRSRAPRSRPRRSAPGRGPSARWRRGCPRPPCGPRRRRGPSSLELGAPPPRARPRPPSSSRRPDAAAASATARRRPRRPPPEAPAPAPGAAITGVAVETPREHALGHQAPPATRRSSARRINAVDVAPGSWCPIERSPRYDARPLRACSGIVARAPSSAASRARRAPLRAPLPASSRSRSAVRRRHERVHHRLVARAPRRRGPTIARDRGVERVGQLRRRRTSRVAQRAAGAAQRGPHSGPLAPPTVDTSVLPARISSRPGRRPSALGASPSSRRRTRGSC